MSNTTATVNALTDISIARQKLQCAFLQTCAGLILYIVATVVTATIVVWRRRARSVKKRFPIRGTIVIILHLVITCYALYVLWALHQQITTPYDPATRPGLAQDRMHKLWRRLLASLLLQGIMHCLLFWELVHHDRHETRQTPTYRAMVISIMVFFTLVYLIICHVLASYRTWTMMSRRMDNIALVGKHIQYASMPPYEQYANNIRVSLYPQGWRMIYSDSIRNGTRINTEVMFRLPLQAIGESGMPLISLNFDRFSPLAYLLTSQSHMRPTLTEIFEPVLGAVTDFRIANIPLLSSALQAHGVSAVRAPTDRKTRQMMSDVDFKLQHGLQSFLTCMQSLEILMLNNLDLSGHLLKAIDTSSDRFRVLDLSDNRQLTLTRSYGGGAERHEWTHVGTVLSKQVMIERLQTLNLSACNLDRLEQLHDMIQSFNKLKALKYLDLSQNNFDPIQITLFRTLLAPRIIVEFFRNG